MGQKSILKMLFISHLYDNVSQNFNRSNLAPYVYDLYILIISKHVELTPNTNQWLAYPRLIQFEMCSHNNNENCYGC